ncbi:MAG TPA: hypothetical protein VLA56_06845, partial [Pseudomonadales bacterium]|nr:hypothetical protein [Pseudomonadales bacterium]
RLLVARAALERDSRCEPDVSQQTVELSEGFAPLLRHADGTRSTTWILAHLRHAGASDEILRAVQGGFRQLLDAGMLETV